MASWWKSASATNLTRGLSNITGQLSTNLKDILTEASEETFDPNVELQRAREQIDDLEFRKQALLEECANLKKKCDELLMQKQTAEIKSDMLLAESRRTIDEKDNELKRLRENVNAMSWNTTKDLNNTWTDILEDDQPEINEYVKYQKMIREIKDENNHLRDELVSVRKNLKIQQNDKISSEQYEEKLQQLQIRIAELEQSNQNDEIRQTVEVEKEMNDVDKDLLSQELDQANEKLNWYNEKFKEFVDLQEKFDVLTRENEQLKENSSNLLERLNESEQIRLEKPQSEDREEQTDLDDQFEHLLIEERQRCDALAKDNESICQILEQTRSQLESNVKHQEELLEDLQNEKDERIKETNIRELLERQLIELNENLQSLENEKTEIERELNELKENSTKTSTQPMNIVPPGSPAFVVSSSPDVRARSPSPSTFEHLLELEAQILRHEETLREFNSIYDRFASLLPVEISPSDKDLPTRFDHLFDQWSTYIETLSITQQENESLKQLLNEKEEDLEKLQSDLDLTTMKLVEIQEKSQTNENENEEEIEQIFDLQSFAQRAPSRQSLVSTTPGEKQQLIAHNELLLSLLAEKDRELISLQQAEKTREDLIKNLDNLKTNLQQMELEREVKQVELNDIRNVLDEKLRENSSLKKEKMYFIEKLAEMERERQEVQTTIQVAPRQSISDDEKSTPTFEENPTDDKYEKLRVEYEQLVEFSKKQHEESVSYYNEYTRILNLYNELNSKQSQYQIEYESLQSMMQQKNEAYLQCQNELNNFQNLFYQEKKKSEETDLLRSTLIEREHKLQQYVDRETELLVKQSDLERQVKILEQNIFELKTNEQLVLEQIQQNNVEQMRLELRRFTQERDLAIVEKKKLEQEIESIKQKFDERERKLTSEIERLRTHLLQMEESCTNDLLAAEEREKSFRSHIAQIEDTNRAQAELIQQLNTTGEQSKQSLATELASLKHEHHKLEEINQNLNQQLQYQLKCSQNLQNVLEQFKREREQHLNEHLRQYQDAVREQTAIATRLTTENNEIRTRLAEYNEAMAAAHRLTDQMQKKDSLINGLRSEIQNKEKQLQQYEQNLRDLQSTSGSRVEKQLVKNILLSYFHTPVDKRQEVVPLLGALVGFTQEEYRRAIDATSTNASGRAGGGTGWLSGWLGGNNPAANAAARTRTQSETPAYDPNKSFTELLIQYVDQQSTNNPQFPTAKFNTDDYLQRHDHNTALAHPNLLRKPSIPASNFPSIVRPASAIGFPLSNNITFDGSNFHSTPPLPPPPSATATGIPIPPLPTSSATISSTSNTTESSSTILKDLLKT